MSNTQIKVSNKYDWIRTERRSDAELDLYFGGRATYLAALQKSLEETISSTYSPTYDQDDPFAKTFSLFVSAEQDRQDWEAQKERTIAELNAAIIANS